jgi:hypothetical protein
MEECDFERLEWVKRAPFGPGAEIEIRQVFETAGADLAGLNCA